MKGVVWVGTSPSSMGNELGEALPVVYVVRQTLVACGLIPPHFVGTHLLRVETINQQFCVIENPDVH